MVRTVLIVDDSESVRHSVERVLRDHQVTDVFLTARDGREACALLTRHTVTLVFCDPAAAGFDEFELLRLKGGQTKLEGVPVILLATEEDTRATLRALRAGADDYLTKPFHDEELVARARVHLRLRELQDELRDKSTLLETLNRTDGLTGLLNRRSLVEVLGAEFAKCTRYRAPLSLVMVDLDRFKKVNDTFGHPVGNAVLKTVARVIRAELRACDAAARFGGEEFALLLPQTDRAGAIVAAERCRTALEAARVPTSASAVSVTASFGVATWPHPQVARLDDLVSQADQALYRAKSEGRNRVVAL